MPIIRTGTTPVVSPTPTLADQTPTAAGTTTTPSRPTPIPSTTAATAAALADATTSPSAAVATLAGGSDVVGADGSLFPGLSGDNLQAKLIELAMPAEAGTTKPGAFDSVTNAALLTKAAKAIEKAFDACTAQPPDEATGLAWRQVRASCLHLLQQVALRVNTLGGDVKAVLKQTVEVIKKEPNRALRDFAFEDLIGHAEAKKLPEVKEARALLYPETPPYADWPKTVKVVRYCDDDGSKIEDNIWFFVEMMGAKHTANPDGSHDFVIKKRGAKHDIEVHIPPKSDGLNIVAPVGDGKTHVIEYCGHAGHGNFFEAALASGAKGTGQGQVMAAYQCWGEGNTETLERQIPDLQYLSTTEMTSDNYDFVMQKRFFDGIMEEQTWDQMLKGTIADLKRDYKDDIKTGELKVDTHYLPPNNRGRLLTHYDRDGDGVRDGEDHIFNVVYPRRVDTSGGYDPVVQAVPRFALDGSELSKSVNALTLILRYDHVLAPSDEAKVVWDPNKWQPGGFFEPQADNLRAFQFTKTATGDVRVALSTRFAQTSREDLQRMLAIETGIWLGKEARLTPAKQGALAVTLLQRMVEGQGEWFSKEDGLLDEFWAEEQMLFSRYGLSGFSIADITSAIGMTEHDDFLPKHFTKAEKFLKQRAPDLGELGTRNPTRVGAALNVPGAGISLLDGQRFDVSKVSAALAQLGVTGEVENTNPSWISMPMTATNMLVTVKNGNERTLYGLGIDTTGTLLAAAKLSFDFTKKIDGSLTAALARLAASGGQTVREAQAAFQTAKATHTNPFEAFVAAAKTLRGTASPSASFDGSFLYELHSQGLIDDQASAALTKDVGALFPSEYQLRAETALFAALSASKELDKKMGPITAAFNQAILTGNGSEAAWLKAAEVLRDAIPKKLTLPPDANVTIILDAMQNSSVLAAARKTLTTALGFKTVDLTVLALESLLPGVPEVAAAKNVLRETFQRSGDAVEAILAALDSIPSLSIYNYEGTLNLDRYGVFAPDDPALKIAIDRIASHKTKIFYQDLVRNVLLRTGTTEAALTPATLRYRTAVAAGKTFEEAVGTGIGTIAKDKAASVLNLLENMWGAPEGFDPAKIAQVVANAMGMTRAELTLTQQLTNLESSGASNTTEALRAFRSKFVETERATGSLVDAIAAGALALLPLSFKQSAALVQMVAGGVCVTADEGAAIQAKLLPLHQLYDVRTLAESAVAHASTAEQKRVMKAIDSAFVRAAGTTTPLESALAALKTIKAPAAQGDISIDFYALSSLPAGATRTAFSKEIIRLRGLSVDDYVREFVKMNLMNGHSPTATLDENAMKTAIDAAFARGLKTHEAILEAVRAFVASNKTSTWPSVESLTEFGLFETPPDFTAQLESAQRYVPN